MSWWQYWLLAPLLLLAAIMLWLRSVAREVEHEPAMAPAVKPAPASAPRRKRRAKPAAAPTRADKALRQAHWRQRMPQLLANVERRPYWQLRTADDGRDNAACQADHGRVERYDSEFWQRRSPAKCRRTDCRCSIRAYSLQDLAERGIEPPT